MENFFVNLETAFFFVTGINLGGVAGLIVGLGFFCLVILALRFERSTSKPTIEASNLSEVGDENIAKINLSRSLIEMDQLSEAYRLLIEVVESNELSSKEKKIADSLLDQISNGRG